MIYILGTLFLGVRISTSGAERSSRPKGVVTSEIVIKSYWMIVYELDEALSMLAERLYRILHEYLNMKKLST